MGYWKWFKTSDLDMMAAIMADSGCIPQTYQSNPNSIVFCRIKVWSAHKDITQRYLSGELKENERTFSESRCVLESIVEDCKKCGGTKK